MMSLSLLADRTVRNTDKNTQQTRTVKNRVNLHQIWWQLNCHLFWCNLSTDLKATRMF